MTGGSGVSPCLCSNPPCLFITNHPFSPKPGPVASKHDPTPIPLQEAPCRILLRANHLSQNPSLLSDSNLNPPGCSPSPFPLVQSPAGDGQQLVSIVSGINCTRNNQRTGTGISGWMVLFAGWGAFCLNGPQSQIKSHHWKTESQLETRAKTDHDVDNCEHHRARCKAGCALKCRLPKPQTARHRSLTTPVAPGALATKVPIWRSQG